MIRIGIDVGSTTAKMVAIREDGRVLYTKYERHNAKAKEVVIRMLNELVTITNREKVSIKITGSVGMGFSEKYGFPFVQEVVAATKAIQTEYPNVVSMIDIGGEDAKVVFFKYGEAVDLRMNGNCAGGTGAFIDQMAVILGVSVEEMNDLAMKAEHIYPIASRCGVFCKTDIQNLIAKNVSREDIAASIFHAVAVQTIVTLARGYDIKSPILFCGGPLTFIPALRKSFIEYLSVKENEIILPENGTLLPAFGTALTVTENESERSLDSVIAELEKDDETSVKKSGLEPIFSSPIDYMKWKEGKEKHTVKNIALKPGIQEVYIGIDSGSTTTKIVVTDKDSNLIYKFYCNNGGKPIETVEKGLKELLSECKEKGCQLIVKGSCSTGYGEDLIKAAFQLDNGIVETIAHYMGAHHFDENVSFILDIGGQDMKAIFVNNGIIDRIEINEACSSGCGSFIETFAKTLGYTAQEFSLAACRSDNPADLGTRCTVFMNSKVKQVLREGATVEDIAAGLAYSVVKNCLYKVLKLKDTSVLGKHLVVQGGTMRNDAIVKALEMQTGTAVTRCNIPELMGAYGCALYAREHSGKDIPLEDMICKAKFSVRSLNCKGCDNHCPVISYRFESGKHYYSGNRCEKVFTNGEKDKQHGDNMYLLKNELLFNRKPISTTPSMTIGIPRCLNMYEEYPFWHTLFETCNLSVILSDVSDYTRYECSARMVMSDNICFPAKLVHSHIQDLIDKKVSRIFMPFVIFEHKGQEQNSYNCPIVTGYSEVVKSVQGQGIAIDSPTITFKDKNLLFKQCCEYLSGIGIDIHTIKAAFEKACSEQEKYVTSLVEKNEEILKKAKEEKRMTVLLAGRPYHTDMLIQHKVSDMLADMGISIITDDIVRRTELNIDDVHFLPQWSYPNRILKAAKWVCSQDSQLQFVELTSFGCGPDAFLVDEIRDLMIRNRKVFTLLKLDDVNNIGSMKLRVRSLIESIRLAEEEKQEDTCRSKFETVPVYDSSYRERKILVPFFTPFISPLIPAIMKVAGYEVETLPISDNDSCEWGLKYANNEICYPATLVVGDIIKAFKSGSYDPDKSVIAMTQTGGQCRASNYVAIIRKALIDAGYCNTPVVSLTMGGSIRNEQPAFKINWLKVLPVAFRAVLYSDCISKFYYASVVREKKKGEADRLKELYLKVADDLIRKNKSKDLFGYLSLAAAEFNGICTDKQCPKVGVVGEIYLKFNPFAHRNLLTWLTEKGIEVMPPVLSAFFMQSFVNREEKIKSHVIHKNCPNFIYKDFYRIIHKQIEKVNAIAGKFRYYIPFEDIFEQAEEARNVINLNAQFGEGWLLPAEIMSFAKTGVYDIISLQPFGCIANHIVSKGIEKRIKTLVPDMNILSLDFDSGVSEVNIINRMLLFIDKLKNKTYKYGK
jgi:coA enzyme activase